jgi:hypothetical protein
MGGPPPDVDRHPRQGAHVQGGCDRHGRVFATRPNAATNFPVLRRGAWDAALSTGALRLVDYTLAARLSEIYQMQTVLESDADKVNSLQGPFFDPTGRAASVQQLWFWITGVEHVEQQLLLPLYRQHLPAIRAAANAAR